MVRPEQETGKGTRAGTAGSPTDSPATGNDPFGIGEWLKDMPKVPLYPLMQHPAAAMAAATAIGLGVTSQIAGFMLGAMQGMTETARKTDIVAEEAPVAKRAEPKENSSVVADVAPMLKTPAKAQVKAKPARMKPVIAEVVKAAPVTVEKPKRQKAGRVVETQADDLKRISGIGPKLEQVLNGMGVRRYADVALWADKDVQRIEEQLGFGGRIARDGWVEQAKTLMKGRD